MEMQHWLMLAAVLAIGYFIGYKYPRFGQQLGI